MTSSLRASGSSPTRIDHLLSAARSRLCRLDARQVPAALKRGAVLVDIRPQEQREREGGVPAALVIERNVLEWRCDPTSDARLPQAVGDDVEWVVLCSEGYTSSLAAAALQDLGLYRSTDVVGGYWALRNTGVLDELASAPIRAPSQFRAVAPSSPASTRAVAGSPPTR